MNPFEIGTKPEQLKESGKKVIEANLADPTKQQEAGVLVNELIDELITNPAGAPAGFIDTWISSAADDVKTAVLKTLQELGFLAKPEDKTKASSDKKELPKYKEYKLEWPKDPKNGDIFIKSEKVGSPTGNPYPSPVPIPPRLQDIKDATDAGVQKFLKEIEQHLQASHDVMKMRLKPKGAESSVNVDHFDNPLEGDGTLTIPLSGPLPDWLLTELKRIPELRRIIKKDHPATKKEKDCAKKIINFTKNIEWEARKYLLTEAVRSLGYDSDIPEYTPLPIEIPEDAAPAAKPVPAKPAALATPPSPAAAGAGAGVPPPPKPPEKPGVTIEDTKFSSIPEMYAELLSSDKGGDKRINFDISSITRSDKGKIVSDEKLLKDKKVSKLAAQLYDRIYDALESIIKTQVRLLGKAKKDSPLLTLNTSLFKTTLTLGKALEAASEDDYKDALDGKSWDGAEFGRVADSIMKEALWPLLTKGMSKGMGAEALLQKADGFAGALERFYLENLEEKAKESEKAKGKTDAKDGTKKPDGKKEEAGGSDEAKKAKAEIEAKYSYLTPGEMVIIQLGDGANARVEEFQFVEVGDDGKTMVVQKKDPDSPGDYIFDHYPEKQFGLLNRELKQYDRVLWQNSVGELSEDWQIQKFEDDKTRVTLMGIGSNLGALGIPNIPVTQLRKFYPKLDLEAKPKVRRLDAKTKAWETDWIASPGKCMKDSDANDTEQAYPAIQKPGQPNRYVLEAKLMKWNPPAWVKATTPEGMTEFEATITNPQDKAFIASIKQWLDTKKSPAQERYKMLTTAHEQVRRWMSSAEERPR